VTLSRSEFVQRLVLNWITDDLENVDQVILRHVAEDAAKCGLTVERSEVVAALAGLIEEGLAKAYILSGVPGFSKGPPRQFQGMPPVEVVEEDFRTYFYATKKGMDLHLSDDTWWPFDDEGKPLPDWHLTSDGTL
jgi:hypothetical protein